MSQIKRSLIYKRTMISFLIDTIRKHIQMLKTGSLYLFQKIMTMLKIN